MKRVESIVLIAMHVVVALLSFLFIVMSAEMGQILQERLRRGPNNLPILLSYGVAEHGLFLFSCMLLFFNLGTAIAAWRVRTSSMVRVVAIVGALLELAFVGVLFAVVVYAHICSR